MRLGGIEPPTCGLKGRCSLAPRRLPLTTELQAHWLVIADCRWMRGRDVAGTQAAGTQPSIAAYTSSSNLARSTSWKLSAR